MSRNSQALKETASEKGPLGPFGRNNFALFDKTFQSLCSLFFLNHFCGQKSPFLLNEIPSSSLGIVSALSRHFVFRRRGLFFLRAGDCEGSLARAI